MKTYILIAAAATFLPHVVGVGAHSDLTKVERDGLTFMREEEKLARDVYRTLEIKWGARPFGNIARAEENHMESVKGLLDQYSIKDPVAKDTPGKFEDADLQKLYGDLTKRGEKSRIEALKVGALIEELDIADLKKRADQTTQPDIDAVYENLMRGSRNHLRAFYRTLTRSGGSYTPVHISKAEFDKIVNGSG